MKVPAKVNIHRSQIIQRKVRMIAKNKEKDILQENILLPELEPILQENSEEIAEAALIDESRFAPITNLENEEVVFSEDICSDLPQIDRGKIVERKQKTERNGNDRHGKGSNKNKKTSRKAVGLIAGIVLLAAAGVAAWQIQGQGGLPNLTKETNVQAASTAVVPKVENISTRNALEKWQEGTISYNEKEYRYNQNLHTYLIMGIDKDGEVEEAPDLQSGGQSDAMFLLIANTDTQELSVVAINRNTMTDIYVTNARGEYLNTVTAQICLQHAYGDGKRLSCTRAKDAVSNLFYNLPISGYCAINMGGIPAMNDALGGISVTALQSLSYPEDDVDIVKGKTINLMGMEAYYYLRSRDIEEFASADLRLDRQIQYVQGFMTKAKADSSAESAMKVYNAIADYLVTDVNFTDVMKELLTYDFDPSRIYTIPGETVMGDIYEEYHVDEDAFYEMNLDLFYEEVK